MSESVAPKLMPVSKGQAGADPWSIPLAKIDVSDAELFETDTLCGFFERLRKEDPVHYCAESEDGPCWSVTRFDDVSLWRPLGRVDELVAQYQEALRLKPDLTAARENLRQAAALLR